MKQNTVKKGMALINFGTVNSDDNSVTILPDFFDPNLTPSDCLISSGCI